MTTVLLFLLAGASPARAEVRSSFLMDGDPEIHVPPTIRRISPTLKSLWFEALARPEADMQRLAADAIMRGHAFDDKAGLEQAVPRLETVLTNTATHPSARLAAARALVELEAKASAASMAASAEQFGADLRQVIEPALAQWDYRPMRDVWRARLKEPQTHHRELLLAVRCLAAAGDDSAARDLLSIVHNAERSVDLRIEAARSAGILVDKGLETEARAVMANAGRASIANRLCGVQMIARHAGDDAVSLLKEFAVDTEPAIAAIALARLVEIDPHLVLPLSPTAIHNTDVKVRRLAAQAYVQVPDASRVTALARLLNDPHPGVRHQVCEWLHELSRIPELDEPIRRCATEILDGDDWRGLEQASLLLAALDHKAAAQRLVELADSGRGEVRIAAAWGSKMLAVPETLPALLTVALRRTETRMGNVPAPSDLDVQTAHLLELFGKTKYREAEPLLKRYIPRELVKMGVFSRPAAIWSLGHLHAGIPDEDLAKQLAARIADVNSSPSEVAPVRAMSAVSIGRMKAVSQTTLVRQFMGDPIVADELPLRFRWAVMELTGEFIPEPTSPIVGKGGWFLEPLAQ